MERKKTALVLGGGGSRGAYEIGVWQALRELGISIDIVTGTSIGAVNGAIIAQGDVESLTEIWNTLEKASMIEFTEGKKLEEILDKYLDEEKIRNSQIKFGTVAVELPNFEAHKLFIEEIPKGKLKDYIIASAAFYPIREPHLIDGKKFIDGAFNDNMPVGMALESGAQHVIAVNLEALGIIRKSDFKGAERFMLISPSWDLGNFTEFEPDNIKRIMRLGYLDAMKGFGVFFGTKYTFIKGEFAKKILQEAEAAATIFELDPLIVYSKEILDLRLSEKLEEYQEHKKSKNKSIIEMLKTSRITATMMIKELEIDEEAIAKSLKAMAGVKQLKAVAPIINKMPLSEERLAAEYISKLV